MSPELEFGIDYVNFVSSLFANREQAIQSYPVCKIFNAYLTWLTEDERAKQSYLVYREALLKGLTDIRLRKSILHHLLPQIDPYNSALYARWVHWSNILNPLKQAWHQRVNFRDRKEGGFCTEHTFAIIFTGGEVTILGWERRVSERCYGSRSLALHHYHSFTVWDTSLF